LLAGFLPLLFCVNTYPKKMRHNKSFAAGRMKAGVMNPTEAWYAEQLEELKRQGAVQWYKFEGITFKLAPRTTYTPDFAVMMADNTIELHEVKGFWQGTARVKIKLAAELFPFKFLAIVAKKVAKKNGGGFDCKIEEF